MPCRRRAVARHACVDFHLHSSKRTLSVCRGGKSFNGAPIGHRRGKVQTNDFGVVLGVQAAKQEDRLLKLGLAQSAGFADSCDGRAAGAGLDRGRRNRGCAHTVRLSLHDRGDAMSRLGGGLERANVVGDRVQIDLDPAQHRLDGKACIICGRTDGDPTD